MDKNLLKYMAFVETVDRGSFTRAAKSLHYAQSSVSKMVADLEQEWNITLLQRSKNGICLTSDGEKILPLARKILQDFREMEAQIDQINGLERGMIRIGSFSSVAIHWLPEIFARFQKQYPGIEYEILMGDYSEIEHWIEEGRVDCGFLRLPCARELDAISLNRDEYFVVMPEEHPLAACDKIRYEDLEGEPFLLLEHGGRTEVSELLDKHGAHPDIRFTTWEDFAIMSMAEKGLGIGILSGLILRRNPYRIAVRPLAEPYYREIGIVVRDQEQLSSATQRFIRYLQGLDMFDRGVVNE